MNAYFKETLRILKDSLGGVDEGIFSELVSECAQTLKCGHKVIASGLGKNVPICEKFEGTMVSMGFDAAFLHTNSAVHGDLGLVKSGDLVIILTKSGSTSESVYLTNLIQKRTGVNLWLLTCQKDSILDNQIGKSLIVPLEHEGDQWNIMPNNSSTLFLIVLQALAMTLAKVMNVKLEDFKPNHPGGAIGELLANE